jgi:hypothetical protein
MIFVSDIIYFFNALSMNFILIIIMIKIKMYNNINFEF